MLDKLSIVLTFEISIKYLQCSSPCVEIDIRDFLVKELHIVVIRRPPVLSMTSLRIHVVLCLHIETG